MCILDSSHGPQQLNTVVPQRDTDQKLKSDIVRLHGHIQSPRLEGFSLRDGVRHFFSDVFFPPNCDSEMEETQHLKAKVCKPEKSQGPRIKP